MACRNCGHNAPPDATVCPECGADLTAAHDAASHSAADAAALRAVQDAQTPPPVKPGKGRWLAIVAIVAAFLLFALCATFGVYNVIAIQQLHQRSAARNAVTQQRPVPAPNTIGQTDNESGTGEPDTDIGTGTDTTVAPQSHNYNASSPEAAIVVWYSALNGRDVAQLKKLVDAGLWAQTDTAALLASPKVTDYRLTRVTTSGGVSRITVDQTAGARTVARFTLTRSAGGAWVITSFK